MAAPNDPAETVRLQDDAALQLIERYHRATVEELRAALEGRSGEPYALMRYHLGWEDRDGRPVEGRAGKLLRPGLCLLCCDAVGGEWRRALPAAAALELLHNFTLVHDDVEDASRHRHGRETLWSLRGEAEAINVGDGLFALAHATLLRLSDAGHAAERVLEAIRMVDEATVLLCEGQHRDLSSAGAEAISRDDYLAMIEGKTAALLAAACSIGALLGGAPGEAIAALYEFGRRIGLAFQIRDDVLGVWGDVEETGKPTGDDLRAGKQSYPVVVALERASADERATLQGLLTSDELSEDDVARGCTLMERLGAREAGEEAALEHADAAVASLDKLPLSARWRGDLARLAVFAARRRS